MPCHTMPCYTSSLNSRISSNQVQLDPVHWSTLEHCTLPSVTTRAQTLA